MFAGCWIFADRALFRFTLYLKLKLHKVFRIMLCIFLLLCVIRRPQSLTLFDVVHYSQTASNRESWGGLSQSKFKLHCCTAQWQHFQNLVVYIYKNLLFRGEIAIIQVFDEDKIAITSLLWRRLNLNGHFLFRFQHNCPVFPSNI